MVSLMCESVNVSWKVAAEKAGSVFAYFWHKNNFRLKFCGSFKWKKIWECEINFWKKTEVLYAERNERAEAATGSYSVTGNSLQYIYSGPV